VTTKDFTIKWLAYALALLPVWFLEAYLLSRYPLFGVKPMLLPLCAVAVATLEGATAGAGFGLAVGLLFDAMDPGAPGAMIFVMALLGLGAGLLAQYVLRQDLIGCFLCSALALVAMDALRVAVRLLMGTAPLRAMLELAGREILWSICFVPLVYLIFRWVFRRVPKATVL
jgi:rod shape-determining protein MreD